MIATAKPSKATSRLAAESSSFPPLPDLAGVPSSVQTALDAAREHPASIDRRHALGDALRAAAYHREAIASYEAVIQLEPQRASAWRDLGNVLADSGDVERGVDALRRAVELEPNEAGAVLGLIRTLQKCGRASDATPYVEQLGADAARHGNDARRRLYYGLGLSQLGRLDEAITEVRRAVAMAPSDAEAWDFLGMLLADRRAWTEAREAYDRALTLVPGRPQTLFNRATLRLRLGDIAGGLQDYEARFDSPLFTTPRQDYGVPRWRGEPLAGRTLLIHTEQGLGDTIQFARFIAYAKTAGAGRIVVECEDSLGRLLASVAGVDELVRRGEAIPAVDLHAPLMSLAHLSGATFETIPTAPYFGVDRNRRALPPRPAGVRWRVGIVWEASRSGGSFRAKSVALDAFAPLAARSDVQLFSLQKGPGEQALADSPLRSCITDLGGRAVDLRDTAEMLSQLDVVITVDTAVCHLAGAMGVTVFTLVPRTADWRWLLDRDDSPWYPSMRLFRQDESGSWQTAMDAAIAALDRAPSRAPGAQVSAAFAPRAMVPQSLHLLAALQHAARDEFIEAAHAYNDALMVDGSNADIWNNFGVALAKTGRLPECEAAFARAVSVQADHADAQRNLSAVREAMRGAPRGAPQGDLNAPRFAIDWQVGTNSGWGIYGMNLVAHTLRRGQFTPVVFYEPRLEGASPLQLLALRGLAAGQQEGARVLSNGGHCAFPTLHALGNGLRAGEVSDQLRSTRRLGMVFFENTHLDAIALDRGRSYDRLIAGSTWNAELLQANGLSHTALVIQGIDTTLFHPAPRAGWLSNRFVVFSGGKLEYRKGQDLVVAAFAKFRQRRRDALLMVAWHNLWPQSMAEIVTAGHVRDVPEVNAAGQLQLTAWMARYGIPADAVLDLGLVPNAAMAPLVREADVALFPNRAEGGTNLVAMEALASGVPCILSENTGHLDLTDDAHNIVLHRQGPCRPTPSFAGTEGWGESSVDEIVEALEFAYTRREEARERATRAAAVMAGASWHNQIDRLFDAVGDLLA